MGPIFGVGVGILVRCLVVRGQGNFSGYFSETVVEMGIIFRHSGVMDHILEKN